MTIHWFVVPCLALVGCIKTGGDVDLRPMEVAIGAAASLGHASTIAMNAMSAQTACAQVTRACASYPCSDGAVTITLGADCPLPLGGAATGVVSVTGTWQSATQATLSSTFTNVLAGANETVVVSATNVTATPTSVSYTGQDVQAQGASALAAQSTWNVSLDGSKRYTISGTQQAGSGGGAASQLNVSGVVLDPACTLNPVAGSATIQDVGGLSVSQANITFHSACDGKAQADGTPVNVDFFAM
jgi:hypothetical protein